MVVYGPSHAFIQLAFFACLRYVSMVSVMYYQVSWSEIVGDFVSHVPCFRDLLLRMSRDLPFLLNHQVLMHI